MVDYLIVGAGYAGAVMAERIATQLKKKVLIIDKRNHVAGNCYDLKDENNISNTQPYYFLFLDNIVASPIIENIVTKKTSNSVSSVSTSAGMSTRVQFFSEIIL